MAQGTLFFLPIQHVFGATGVNVAGAKAYFFLAGSSTAVAVYTDVGLTIAHAVPVVADGNGIFAEIFLTPGVAYKVDLQTSAGVSLPGYPADNQLAIPVGSSFTGFLGVAGEALTATQAVYLSDGSGGGAAGSWYKADSANTYSSLSPQVGFVPTSIPNGASGTIQQSGRVTGFSSLSIGTQYYIGTAGAITATAPTFARFVGTADSTTSLILSPNLNLYDVGTDLILLQNGMLRRNTADGSDTGLVEVNGGGATGRTRGGGLIVYGNEHASLPGYTRLNLGNAASQMQVLRADGNAAFIVDGTDGHIEVPYGQIYFPATENPSSGANVLDDYEEQSWTPVIGGSGGTSGQTYAGQVGHYVKVGQLVMASFYVVLTAKGTITTSVQIQGLPFTVFNLSGSPGACAIQWHALNSTWVNVVAVPNANTTTATVNGIQVAGSTLQNPLTTTDITNTTELRGTIMYRASA